MTPEQHEIERRRAWVAFMSAAMHNVSQWEDSPYAMADKAMEQYDARFPAPVEREADEATAALEELRAAVQAYINVAYPGKDAECRYDHSGNCQAHNVDNPCTFAAMRDLVMTATPTEPDWIDHTPGDPMPCEPGMRVKVRLRDGETGDGTASEYLWGKNDRSRC